MVAPSLTEAFQERSEVVAVAAALGSQEPLQTQAVCEVRWLTPEC